ncbi:hypothetical protein BAE44_0006831 [Dichanthelium oligosanthes]|uniref:Uncharacterized protein n=1 Tax=Dichanthelium oligosanthes TaxID=888268 RepID=A0A1E5W4C6_9POAL|nr:hypothetical protein BAE44_0006831 [Dichanthelium oligosanthes]
MNEFNVASEVAITEIGYLIENAWRTANQSRFDHPPRPPAPPELLPAVQRVINLIVSLPFIYDSKKDVYTNGKDNKEMIERLFINPVPSRSASVFHAVCPWLQALFIIFVNQKSDVYHQRQKKSDVYRIPHQKILVIVY